MVFNDSLDSLILDNTAFTINGQIKADDDVVDAAAGSSGIMDEPVALRNEHP